MSMWSGLRRLMSRARDEASEVTRIAKIRLDVRTLQGQREQLFREIGRKVYDARNDDTRFNGLEPLCARIDSVTLRIRERQRDLEAVRNRPDTADAAAAQASPSSV